MSYINDYQTSKTRNLYTDTETQDRQSHDR